jgi:hypothetical protein
VFKPSKPFVITALIMLLIGSVLGSLWMMTIFGMSLPGALITIISLHKLAQFNGFITLIIMGIGYLLVPRFRNISLPSVSLVYASYVLILTSIIFSMVTVLSTSQWYYNVGSLVENICRISGVTIFSIIVALVLRTRPKLLKMADYFIALCIMLFVILTISQSLNYDKISGNIQLWLMFPIMMIFGIEYKTLPSFIGFIWPRKTLSVISAALLTLSMGCGLLSTIYQDNMLIQTLFYFSLLTAAATYAFALNVFVGFDNSNILLLSMGEKKARYKYTLVLVKLSYMFLFIGIALSIISLFFSGIFALYDMWIHIIAIGFIGVTIALYFPLMLSPILGRTVRFLHFSKIPIWLIIISLSLRAVGDFFIQIVPHSTEIPYQLLVIPLSLSGWMIVAAIMSFMFIIHRSINKATALPLKSFL